MSTWVSLGNRPALGRVSPGFPLYSSLRCGVLLQSLLQKKPHTMTRQELGGRLKSLREELGVSQVEMADRTGLEPVSISRLETGTKKVSIDILLQYLNGLSYELVFRHLGTGKHF